MPHANHSGGDRPCFWRTASRSAPTTSAPRDPVSERLERAVGPELLRFLLVALTGDNRMRSTELVA